MTHIPSYRNVISIKHTDSDGLVTFWLVLLFRERILYSLVEGI